MNIREALIQQSPSLALQRAAGDEIARLDHQVLVLGCSIENYIRHLRDLAEKLAVIDPTFHIPEVLT